MALICCMLASLQHEASHAHGHGGCQMKQPAPAGKGAGSRAEDSHGRHVLHVDQGRDQFLL
eukprot:scaffold21819_cov65-Phaeocystis_antarctica.AAC.4